MFFRRNMIAVGPVLASWCNTWSNDACLSQISLCLSTRLPFFSINLFHVIITKNLKSLSLYTKIFVEKIKNKKVCTLSISRFILRILIKFFSSKNENFKIKSVVYLFFRSLLGIPIKFFVIFKKQGVCSLSTFRLTLGIPIKSSP